MREQGSAIEFIVKDEGVPVALEKCERRAVPAPDPTSLMPGGLGVQLIYSVFDEVEFHPGKTSGNRVVMRVKRPEKKTAQ